MHLKLIKLFFRLSEVKFSRSVGAAMVKKESSAEAERTLGPALRLCLHPGGPVRAEHTALWVIESSAESQLKPQKGARPDFA